jgi:hypothetical protein
VGMKGAVAALLPLGSHGGEPGRPESVLMNASATHGKAAKRLPRPLELPPRCHQRRQIRGYQCAGSGRRCNPPQSANYLFY